MAQSMRRTIQRAAKNNDGKTVERALEWQQPAEGRCLHSGHSVQTLKGIPSQLVYPRHFCEAGVEWRTSGHYISRSEAWIHGMKSNHRADEPCSSNQQQ